MYTCKHFDIRELVDRATFKEKGKDAWGLFKENALRALDDLREFIGAPGTVNDWHEGGDHEYRGYRPQSCTEGAPKSEHRNGNAFDINFKGWTAEEVRQKVLADKDNPLVKRIMRMESGVTWVHFDLKLVPDRIRLFTA